MAEEKTAPKPSSSSSAEKRARSNLRRRSRNQAIRSRIRTGLNHFSELLVGQPAAAREAGFRVISWLDRAAKANVLHRNAARRRKAGILDKLRAPAVK